ncbi:MAG: transporter, partial [Spirochaetae bacterium HGW-Spirochaetae-8]
VKGKEASLVAFFRSQGLTVANPDVSAFKKQVNDYYLQQKDFIKDWDMDLFDRIKKMAE